MSITQPDFLMVFNESTGSNVTNYGSNVGTYVVAPQAVLNTDYSWHQNLGIYSGSGYLQALTATGAHEPYLSTTATVPGTSAVDINISISFRITSFSNGAGMLLTPGASSSVGNGKVYINTPTVGGDFDLLVEFNNSGGTNSVTHTYTALTFGTDYILSASLNFTTPSAVQAIFQLNGQAAIQPATANWTSFSFDTAWPLLLRRFDLTNYFSIAGRVYAVAYQRGVGLAWNAADINNINTNPSVITGWPGVVSATPTQTPTVTPTKTVTPTQTLTPTMTPTISITPSKTVIVTVSEKLINLQNVVQANITGITAAVFAAVPTVGAPNPFQVIQNLSTDASGNVTFNINNAGLTLNQTVWCIFFLDGSPAKGAIRKVTPIYS